jgi:hypothetical protein
MVEIHITSHNKSVKSLLIWHIYKLILCKKEELINNLLILSDW